MQYNCKYCGETMNNPIYLDIRGTEVELCSNECVVYYYQEYSQENFRTWIAG